MPKTLFIFPVMLMLFLMCAWGQTTVFTDNFSANTDSAYTTSGAINSSAWNVTRSGDDWGARRNTSLGQLEISNDIGGTSNAAGWLFAHTSTAGFSSPFTAILSSMSGVVTWYFNIRTNRLDLEGFSDTSYCQAFVIGATGTDFSSSSTTDGYALIVGNSGTPDPFRFGYFSDGLDGFSTLISSNTAGLTNADTSYFSVKITYNISTEVWEFFLRNDGLSTFTNPTIDSLISQGSIFDSTFSETPLTYMGGYWQGSTAPAQKAFFDNVTVTVTPAAVFEPTVQATNIGFSTVGSNQMNVNWTNGNGSYRIVAMKSGATVDSDPVDAAAYTSNAIFGTGDELGTGNFIVYNGTGSSVTVTGLTASTTYYVRVYEYNGSTGAEDYLTSTATNNPNSQPTSTATSGVSDIITAGNETDNIDYTAKQGSTITATTDAIRVWSFNIRDGGGSVDGDAFGTELTDITITEGSSNSVVDWDSTIQKAALFDDTTKVAETMDLWGQRMVFTGLSGEHVTAPDSGSKTLDLYLTFNSFVTDRQQFQFRIDFANANPAKSRFAAGDAGGASSMAAGDANRIVVTATELDFAMQPSSCKPGTNITPSVTVQAVDLYHNRDQDYTANVEITATGATLSGSPVSATAVEGLATFSTLSFPNPASNVVLNAASGILTNAVSNSFTVYFPLLQNSVMISHLSPKYSSDSAEFVVLFNNSGASIELNGYSICYYSADGTLGGARCDFTTSTVLPAHSYMLLSPRETISVGSVYTMRNYEMTADLETSGQMTIEETADSSNIIFAVAWGTINAYRANMTDAAMWEGDGMLSLAPSGGTYVRTSYNSSNVQYSHTASALITSIPNSSDPALPVELTSFTAVAKGKVVELAWQTATEVNNHGFAVERKTIDNGKLTIENWKQVGFVAGNGTTDSPKWYSFVDATAKGNVSYRLKQVDNDGKFEYSNEVEVMISQMPQMFALMQNSPNPFNPTTKIGFALPVSGFVSLKIYDMLGREVQTLVNEATEAGEHAAEFNASQYPSGIYFYTLRTSNFTAAKKMLMIK